MELLQQYSEVTYLLSVVIATFVILKWYFKETTTKQRNIVVTSIGIVLGIVWLEFTDSNTGALVLSFFAAIGFYEKIIKFIMNKLNVKYDESDKGNI